MMKITRLTTHWEIDQVIALLDMLDEIRQSLADTYRQELDEYRHQQWEEKKENQVENMDLFDDIDC